MKDEEVSQSHLLEKAERVAYLIAGFIRHTLTPEEHDELDAWVEASPENMQLFEDLTDEEKTTQGLNDFQQVNTQEGLKRLHQKIQAQARQTQSPRRLSRQLLIMAAAAIIMVAVSGILFFSGKKTTPPATAYTPPLHKTLLVTAAGDTIWLDKTPDGNLAVQGNTQVVKNNDLLSYHGKAQLGISQQTVLNTLTTQRGGQYSLQLSDGSKVWLNAVSSLRYPTAFTEHERKVMLSGEAYFEIAKEAARPFQVWVGNTRIEVMGTHFYVNAYGDDASVKVTVIDGSVRIVQGNESRVIKTGEEASIRQGKISVTKANLPQASGWHNDRLAFNNTPLSDVAKELARWYEVDITFRGHKNVHVSITIDRGLPLDKVVQLLEGTGNVHFSRTEKGLAIE
jgi:ferric-dicitrate binding protein FerR (iron transport regulator)